MLEVTGGQRRPKARPSSHVAELGEVPCDKAGQAPALQLRTSRGFVCIDHLGPSCPPQFWVGRSSCKEHLEEHSLPGYACHARIHASLKAGRISSMQRGARTGWPRLLVWHAPVVSPRVVGSPPHALVRSRRQCLCRSAHTTQGGPVLPPAVGSGCGLYFGSAPSGRRWPQGWRQRR